MTQRFTEVVGVYNADGSWSGELRYVVGKLMGTAHCALCDITHGWVRQKESFTTLCAALPVPIRTVHLDEQSEELASFTLNKAPCVVGRTPQGWALLIDSEALESCGKDVANFERLLRARLEA